MLKKVGLKDLDWILRYLSTITPGITKVEATARAGRRVIVFQQDGPGPFGQQFDASVMSDGTVRTMAILLALKQSPKPSIVSIDEIEDLLHPFAIHTILDAIGSSTRLFPVVVSTHSPEALSHPIARPESIRVVQWKAGLSQVFQLSEEVIDGVRPPQSVGRLLRSNALWTAEDPLVFAKNEDIFQLI